MIQLILYFLTLLSSLIFMQMNHPLAMGLMLLIQTTLICIISGLMTQTYWFSYVLFLIFLGGMLVLFIYVTSLASNEMFSMSMKTLILSSIMLMTYLLMILLIDKTLIYQFIENNEMTKMDNLLSFNQENTLNLNKMYNFPTNLITSMLIIYLLITLIASVKITNVFSGPLRQSM